MEIITSLHACLQAASPYQDTPERADYGSPDDPEAFKWLLAISPVHNVRIPEGGTRQYPAMMLTTGAPIRPPCWHGVVLAS